MYLIKKNGSDWFNYCNENNKYAYQNSKSPKKRQNAKVNNEELATMTNTILFKRREKHTGEEWDDAFRKMKLSLLLQARLEKLSQSSHSIYNNHCSSENVDENDTTQKEKYAYLYLEDLFEIETEDDGLDLILYKV